MVLLKNVTLNGVQPVLVGVPKLATGERLIRIESLTTNVSQSKKPVRDT